MYDTYVKNTSMIGNELDSEVPLIPVFHMTMQATIEVALNEKGEFRRAEIVDGSEQTIIIPCTEASSVRAGQKPEPHPLIDKLQYLAKDYDRYGEKYHGYDKYLEQLKKWADHEGVDSKVRAIYRYIETGTLISDLIESQVFTLDADTLSWGIRAEQAKPKLKPNESVIRWVVEEPGVLESRTWKSKDLMDSWIEYYLSTQQEIGFCYVLGQMVPLADKHPKNIYNMTANAKIISSNDSVNYTYRGRVESPAESYGLSLEVSQKAHNALRWLIAKQGYNRGRKTMICWTNTGVKVPDIYDDGFGFLDSEDLEQTETIDTGEYLASSLKKKLRGYHSTFDKSTLVNLLALESVTDGRLSITYYKQMGALDFIERLENWNNHCQWLHRYYRITVGQDKYKNVPFIGAPSPINIAETVYGNRKNVDERLKLKTVERIQNCIFDGTLIPLDLVRMAFQNTVNREGYTDEGLFEKSLSITCALVKKYYFDYKKEVYTMALDKERTSRDYLYGRLLAVAQNVEQWALSKAGEQRLTNADRLLNRFSTHPYTTWQTLEVGLKPYLDRLSGAGSTHREQLIDEIMSLFNPEEFMNNQPLEGEFLLGYHCQREDLRRKKEFVAATNHDENGGNE
nr:type I-C CRISPR-associated protein Cas8c/Csd1 [Proteiniclasticum sediminis]